MPLVDAELDENFDWVLVDGEFQQVRCQYAAAQALRVQLNMNTGEWFLDIRDGVPYREQIMVHSPNLSVVASLILAAVVATEGILKVNSYTIDLDTVTRHMTMTMDIKTIWCSVTLTAEAVDTMGIILLSIVGPAGPF